jgi:hypothetical protein
MTLPNRKNWLCAALLVGAACRVPDPDPVDPSWVAPENGWPVASPPEGFAGVGYEIGETIPEVRLADQFGDTVSTWQFYGDVVLLVISAGWCRPCHDLAIYGEEISAELEPEGFTMLTVLEEDDGGLDPHLDDAVAWVEEFAVLTPVLVDPEHELTPALQGSYPSVLLLDRELVVVARATELTAETLHDLIESEL